MFELILLVLLVGAIAKIAAADNQSPVLWGAVALVLGFGSVFVIPIPFLRVLIAEGATFVAMIVYKVAANK